MNTVVGDFDGDLPFWEIWSDERGLNFDMWLLPGVQHVPSWKIYSTLTKQVIYSHLLKVILHYQRTSASLSCTDTPVSQLTCCMLYKRHFTHRCARLAGFSGPSLQKLEEKKNCSMFSEQSWHIQAINAFIKTGNIMILLSDSLPVRFDVIWVTDSVN